MDRRAVHGFETRGDLDDVAELVGAVGAHGHDHGALEAASRTARNAGFVHWDIFPFLEMADGEAGLEEGGFEGERAAEEEGHGVVLPVGVDVCDFVEQFAVLPYCCVSALWGGL